MTILELKSLPRTVFTHVPREIKNILVFNISFIYSLLLMKDQNTVVLSRIFATSYKMDLNCLLPVYVI